jgi:vacuolar iron transporter family protein
VAQTPDSRLLKQLIDETGIGETANREYELILCAQIGYAIGPSMTLVSTLRRLHQSLVKSAGTVVFGMEDGTVSIFGLIFGVAATTSNTATVVIAGASGAVAAAVSMMAGAYLDVETTRDALAAKRALAAADPAAQEGAVEALPSQLAAAGLTAEQSAALTRAVGQDRAALGGLILALQGTEEAPLDPWEQALWMLLADFAAAAVPILPFVFLPVRDARIVSGVVTLLLLIGLGIGRARIAKRDTLRTVLETVSIGIAAALAGIGISVLVDRGFAG